MPFNPAIYFIADPACCAGRDIADVVLAAAGGGVTMVQYRDKGGDKGKIAANAALLAELLRPYGIPLIVNDYPEIAQSAGADGVHLGQGDMDPAEARRILGADAIIGLTAFTAEQIRAVDPGIVDYIGTGPVYPTKTDKGKPVLGPEGFAALAKLSPVPVVGIGGITHETAHAVLNAGAAGIAVMRAIGEAADPNAAATQFSVFFIQPG